MLKVAQCWDDGVHDDIRLIEILRKYGACASFNLNPATHGEKRAGYYDANLQKDVHRLARNELSEVYAGFTIANHSLTHPYPTRISTEAWRREVVEARKILQDWFQQPVEGFAYPFGDYNDEAAQIVREAGHLYARTVQNAQPCVPPDDPMAFHASCKFDDPCFWERYEVAKAEDSGVFYFWGHSYELCSENHWQGFEEKIARIAQDGESVWTALPALFKNGHDNL